ncbi:MAG: dihydroorotate dehydrogenase [Spirochaetes bacterium]|nr:dihydroorotate dehydrogenase [Spirochaetota bacterium]
MNLSIAIGPLTLKNPISVASGTAGYGEELSNFYDISLLGAIFTKGLSLKPRPGNKGNRIVETPAGMLNSIGLENVGLEVFLKEKLPFLLQKGATVIPNVAGHSEAENCALCEVLSHTEGIAAIELNVSCPNVKEGGIAFGRNLTVFAKLIESVRKVTKGVLIVKLSPNVTDITEFARAAEDLGADAISAVNTYLGMKIDIAQKRPYFENRVAGLSGPAIKPLAVRAVYEIYSKVKIPIIGIGGISNTEDALEFLMAGASAISIGTMNLVDPNTAIKILEGLQLYLQKENIPNVRDLIGIAHRI